MSATTSTTTPLKGGEWLIKESNAFETFTPEDLNEEQRMVKEMCLQFLSSEVLNNLDRIDKMEQGLMPGLMEKAGEQGLRAVPLGGAAAERIGLRRAAEEHLGHPCVRTTVPLAGVPRDLHIDRWLPERAHL